VLVGGSGGGTVLRSGGGRAAFATGGEAIQTPLTLFCMKNR
jgi:hypothetical protein